MCLANVSENWSSRKPHRHSKNGQTAHRTALGAWDSFSGIEQTTLLLWGDSIKNLILNLFSDLFIFSSLGLQQSSLGVIIFTGNSIFSPRLTASSDTACSASRQKKHFVGLSTSFFCKEQKTKQVDYQNSVFLFWNWCKEKKENNAFGHTRIIVENNGRNFYGTFKEKKQQQQFRRKTCPPRIITSSHIHSRLNFNLHIRCFLHSSASLQFCYALYDSFQRAAIAVTHLCWKQGGRGCSSSRSTVWGRTSPSSTRTFHQHGSFYIECLSAASGRKDTCMVIWMCT